MVIEKIRFQFTTIGSGLQGYAEKNTLRYRYKPELLSCKFSLDLYRGLEPGHIGASQSRFLFLLGHSVCVNPYM